MAEDMKAHVTAAAVSTAMKIEHFFDEHTWTVSYVVALRKTRDAALGAPALTLPSLQVNIRGGELADTEVNGIAYLKIPVNALGGPS